MRALLLVLLVPTLAAAEPTPLRLTGHERIPARLSDGLVAAQIGLAVKDAWQAPDRRHALGCLALENGLALGATEFLKRVVHRTRPDGSDQLSFPSGHTALAAVNARGWRWSVTANVAIGRQMAGKHYLTDTLGGFALGAGLGRLCD